MFTSGVLFFFQHITRLYSGAMSVIERPYLTACTGLIVNFGYSANMLHTALCHGWGGQLPACHYRGLDTIPHRSKVGYVVHKVVMGQVFLHVCRLPCRYHFTSAPHSFIHQAPTLYNLRNWQRRSVTLLKHKTLIYATYRQFKQRITEIPKCTSHGT
jgi:hypothetical protein